MTAFNRERYIGAAIESVLAQTFTDFELVVVDDCSTDGTVRIAEGFTTDPRVRVHVNEHNLGDYPNRNRAASLARGTFVKYHDSDDLLYPHCLSVMVPALAAEPRAGFAVSGSRAWSGGPCPMLLTPRLAYEREFVGFGLFSYGPAGGLFRAEVLRGLGGFPERGPASDLLFWARACARHCVLLLPCDLFWYRVHGGQERQSERGRLDYALADGEIWQMLRSGDCPLDGPEREQALRNWLFVLLKHSGRDLGAGRPAMARLRLRHAGLAWSDWLRYLRPPRRSADAGTPRDERTNDYVVPDWSRLTPRAKAAEPNRARSAAAGGRES
jgi:hypothetical protein